MVTSPWVSRMISDILSILYWVKVLPATTAGAGLANSCIRIERLRFISCFQAEIAFSTIVNMGLYLGRRLIESSPGISSFSTFECGGALSKMQYPSDVRPLSSKKFPDTTCRKFMNLTFVMPPVMISKCSKPWSALTATHTVMLGPFCPDTARYARSPVFARPWLLRVWILHPNSSM